MAMHKTSNICLPAKSLYCLVFMFIFEFFDMSPAKKKNINFTLPKLYNDTSTLSILLVPSI